MGACLRSPAQQMAAAGFQTTAVLPSPGWLLASAVGSSRGWHGGIGEGVHSDGELPKLSDPASP